jgi:hypothetical protein
MFSRGAVGIVRYERADSGMFKIVDEATGEGSRHAMQRLASSPRAARA